MRKIIVNICPLRKYEGNIGNQLLNLLNISGFLAAGFLQRGTFLDNSIFAKKNTSIHNRLRCNVMHFYKDQMFGTLLQAG